MEDTTALTYFIVKGFIHYRPTVMTDCMKLSFIRLASSILCFALGHGITI